MAANTNTTALRFDDLPPLPNGFTLDRPKSPPPPPPGFKIDTPETDAPRTGGGWNETTTISAPKPRGIWDRAVDGATDMVNNFSPIAWAARAVRAATPQAEDFANRGQSPEQIAAARQQRVTQDELNQRALIEGRDNQDPAWRADGSLMGNLARGTAKVGGMLAGGLVSDPTNLINPGGSILRQMGNQALIGAGSDLALQAGENREGTRQGYDLDSAALSGAIGAGGTGLVEGLKVGIPAARDLWKARGQNIPEPPPGFNVDAPPAAPAIFEQFGVDPAQFSNPDAMVAAAARLEANAARMGRAPGIMETQGIPAMAGQERVAGVPGPMGPGTFGRVPEGSVIPVTPEGQAISPRQARDGAVVGLERQRTLDADLMARSRRAAGQSQEGDTFARMLGVESGARQFDDKGKVITSPKGATGIAQVMPSTGPEAAKLAGLKWDAERFRTDPAYNKALGQAYFKEMRRQFPGDERMAVAAYNAGPGNLREALVKARADGSDWTTHLPQETRDYIQKVYGRDAAAPVDGLPSDVTNPAVRTILNSDQPLDVTRPMLEARLSQDAPDAGVYRAPDYSMTDRSPETGYTSDPATQPNRSSDTGNMGEAENVAARQSQTQAEMDARRARGEPMASGTSDRPFKFDQKNQDPDNFWETRAKEKTADAKAEAMARMEAEWQARKSAFEAGQKRAREGAEQRARQGDDPKTRYGDNGYAQKAAKDEAGMWRMTPEGHVAGADGKPVAFRNHKDAARFAVDNELGGDFEIAIWGANSSRVTLRRKDGLAYGQQADAPAQPAVNPDGTQVRLAGPETPRAPDAKGVISNDTPDATVQTPPQDRATPMRDEDNAYNIEGTAIPEPKPSPAAPETAPRGEASTVEGGDLPTEAKAGPRTTRRELAQGNKDRVVNDMREAQLDAAQREATGLPGAPEGFDVRSPRDDYERGLRDGIIGQNREARPQPKVEPQPRDGETYEQARDRAKREENAQRKAANSQAKGSDYEKGYSYGKRASGKAVPAGERKDFTLERVSGGQTKLSVNDSSQALGSVAKNVEKLPVSRFYSNPFFDPKVLKDMASMLVDPQSVKDLGARLGKIVSGLKNNSAMDIVKKALDSSSIGGRPFASYYASNDARLRGLAARFESPTLAKLADMFEARAGKADATDRTYHEAISFNSRRWNVELHDKLKDFVSDDDALARIRDALTGVTNRATVAEKAAAKEVRALLEKVHSYRLDAGEDIGKIENTYFPRVLDAELVARNKPKFIRQAERLYKELGEDNPAEMAEAWWRRAVNEYAGIDGSLLDVRRAKAPGTTSGKERVLGERADALLREFYEKDAWNVLSSYVTGSVRRAEYVRRFGMKGRVDSAERAQWIKDHGQKTQLQVMERDMQDEILASGKESGDAMELTNAILESNLGILGNVSTRVRTGISLAHGWNQIAKMDRSLVTSLNEMAMGFARSGELGKGMKYVADTFAEFGRGLAKLPASEARRYAESMGVILDASMDQTLQSRLSAIETTGKINKAISGFYKAIGLHQWTEASRIAALKMGRTLINDMAGDLASSNARVRVRAEKALSELGVQDPKAFAKFMATKNGKPAVSDVERDVGEAAQFNTALARIISETVLEPTRAQKPLWASHPVGSLAYGLMSYSFGFKKKVLDRMARTAVRSITERDPQLASFAAVGLPALIGVTYVNDTFLRPALFGSTYDYENEDAATMGLRLADRAGMTGAFSPLVNYLYGTKYQRGFLESYAGSVVGSAAQGADRVIAGIRDSGESNGKERLAAGAVYDLAIEPLVDGFAARYVGGPAATAIVYGSGNREEGVMPSDREAFIEAMAGAKKTEGGLFGGSSEKSLFDGKGPLFNGSQ